MTDAQIFIQSLKGYLYGDLGTFKKLCDDIETEEAAQRDTAKPQHTASNSTPPNDELRSTTVETTRPSGSFGTSGYGSLHTEYPRKFRTTVPHALAVFSAMDILGFLIGSQDSPDNTGANIELFLNGVVADPEQVRFLIFIFRNGMAHSFFPKEKIAIAAHSSLEGKDLFFLDDKGVITLNLNTLVAIMKNRFDEILLDRSYDPNIEIQFSKLVESDRLKMSKKDIDLGRIQSSLKPITTL